MKERRNKKAMNRERRVKEMLKRKVQGPRGEMPPPSVRHNDKRRKNRATVKANLRKEWM